VNLRRLLEDKSLFGALYGVYIIILMELKTVVQHSADKKGSNSCPLQQYYEQNYY
jgi:hypothetical protein